MQKILLFIFLVFLLPFQFVRGEFVVPPLPSSPVYDEVGLLKSDEKTTLEQHILTLEQESHHQVAIAIIKSLQGRTIEEAGISIARTWGIGQKGLDNGLLILIAPTEHEMRIEVGRGLEGVMTDLMSQRIIDENLKPHFQVGEYGSGLLEGLDRMTPLLRGEVVDLPESTTSGTSLETIKTIFIICAMFGWGFLSVLSSTKSWWLGGVVGAVIGLIFIGIYGAIFVGIFGLILDYFLSTYAYSKVPLLRNMGNRWGGGGGFGGGSSGGGWGGFGGGGFGGGGASGKW